MTIRFYKINEEYGCFSNFSRHPIFVEGTVWPTVEHFFQASKFFDSELKRIIRLASTPMEATIIGRDMKNPLRHDWDNVKDDIMFSGLCSKFLQNPLPKKILISTDEYTIVEHTSNDSYWGDGGDGSGKNKLGILLMKTRNYLKSITHEPDLISPPWIAFPEIERDDMFWRMGMGEDYMQEWFGAASSIENNKYRLIFPEPKGWEGIYDLD